MTIQLVRVDWLPSGSDAGTTAITLNDVESINVKKDSQAKESHASITLKNPIDKVVSGFNQPFTLYNRDTNDIQFKEGDSIKIYGAEIDSFRALDTSADSADLIMSGEIAEVNVKGTKTGAKVILKIVDKTYTILNRIYTNVIPFSDGKRVPDIVKEIVRFVTNNTESDPVSFDDSGNLVTNGIYGLDARKVSEGTSSLPAYIEDTRIDGTNFPKIALAKVAKPAYDWIQELSSLDSTNNFDGRDATLATDDSDAPTQDRQMIFWVDESNKFHWIYPKGVLTTTLDGAINDSVTTISLIDASDFPENGSVFIGTERIDYIGKSSNDLTNCTRGANNTTAASHSDGDSVRNAITITEGDTTGPYKLLSFNLTKKTFDIVNFVVFNCGADLYGNGITSYYFEKATKSKSLKDTFKAYNDFASKIIVEEINAGRLTLDNTTTSPFFFNGNRYKETTGDYDGGAGITTDWGTVVTSDSEYNTAVRDQSITKGKEAAQKLTARRGSPRWKGTMEFKFQRFTPGDLFEFTSTRAGINQQPLRIKTVQYNFTKMGAFVTLTVEEDEDTLQ